MKTQIFILFALLFGFLTFNNMYSQDGMSIGSGFNNIYDINTVETISGEVLSLDKIYSDNTSTYGVHMALYSGDGLISIHLGPFWFIENQDIEFINGDYVIVTGSRVTINSNQIIIAKEVMKNDKVLLLRDDNGYPLWAAMPYR